MDKIIISTNDFINKNITAITTATTMYYDALQCKKLKFENYETPVIAIDLTLNAL